MAEMTMQDVLAYIDSLTVLQLNELVQALKEKYGVTAAAPVMAMGATPGAAAAAVVEEQTEFTVILTGLSAEKKIQVIKEIRAITGLGLKEAKALVDGAPGVIKEGASKEEANDIKQKVEASGGTVEIK